MNDVSLTLYGAHCRIKDRPRVELPDDPAYVVDDLTLPDDNPWNAWMRMAALDFFDESRSPVGRSSLPQPFHPPTVPHHTPPLPTGPPHSPPRTTGGRAHTSSIPVRPSARLPVCPSSRPPVRPSARTPVNPPPLAVRLSDTRFRGW